jgi:hypothetical protein
MSAVNPVNAVTEVNALKNPASAVGGRSFSGRVATPPDGGVYWTSLTVLTRLTVLTADKIDRVDVIDGVDIVGRS